jgi:hypothetical protein
MWDLSKEKWVKGKMSEVKRNEAFYDLWLATTALSGRQHIEPIT